jgi:transposase InsO family protein/transposase-like protein
MGTEGEGRKRRELAKYTPEQRRAAYEAWTKSGLSQAMFARQWGVNPMTFAGWVQAYRERGPQGLEPGGAEPRGRRGRKPWLPEAVKQEVVAVKRRFPTFGLQKIQDFVRRFAGLSVSTGSVRKVLRAEGIAPTPPVRRRRARRKPVGPPQEFERAHPNELWQSDITYVDVPWSRKPLYLVAFLDDRSRYVVSFGLHAHQKAEIVLEALADGISKYGRPKEVLTDQGRQYFAWRGKCDFQDRLKKEGIQHVVARAHHPQTVGKCERFWKTVQDELWSRVMLRDLEDARERLRHYVAHYNFQRPHQGIEGAAPADRFFGAEEAVRAAVERAVEKNALRLAIGEAPRRPVFLVGQIDGQSVSVHGEGGRVVVQMPDGQRKEIDARDLGINKTKEHGHERGEEHGGDGGSSDAEAAHAAGAQAPDVSGAEGDAAADQGALGGGERGAAQPGAQDGHGDPVDVAGEDLA